jgi:hypothetical protein
MMIAEQENTVRAVMADKTERAQLVVVIAGGVSHLRM